MPETTCATAEAGPSLITDHDRQNAYSAILGRTESLIASDDCDQSVQDLGRHIRDIAMTRGTIRSEPVFEYAWRHLGRREISEQLQTDALRTYLEKPELYSAALGHFLPDLLCEAGKLKLAEEMFRDGTTTVDAGDWPFFERELEARREKTTRSISGPHFGLPRLDAAVGSVGLTGLSIIAGPPGVGKTSLAVKAAIQTLQAEPNYRVSYLSLGDERKSDLYKKILCIVAEVELQTLEKFHQDRSVRRRLTAAKEHLKADILPRMKTFDASQILKPDGVDIETLSLAWTELRGEGPLGELLIVVDGFSDLPVPPAFRDSFGASDSHRMEQLGALLGMEANDGISRRVPSVLVTCDVTAEYRPQKGLNLTHLAATSAIGRRARTVLLMWHASDAFSVEETTRTAVRVAKARDGFPRDLALDFEPAAFRFEEAEQKAVTTAAEPAESGSSIGESL